jgi:hypothetical protein
VLAAVASSRLMRPVWTTSSTAFRHASAAGNPPSLLFDRWVQAEKPVRNVCSSCGENLAVCDDAVSATRSHFRDGFSWSP